MTHNIITYELLAILGNRTYFLHFIFISCCLILSIEEHFAFMKIEADSPIQHLTFLEILKVGDIQTDKPLQNKTARILFLRQTQVWLFDIYSYIYVRISLNYC